MIHLFNEMGISVSETQLEKFDNYYKLLIEENEKYNLTSIVDYEEVYIKHFIDSSLIGNLGFDLNNKRMIDIGTGAGFPAIPIKILNEQIDMTCLDALNKRIGFIQLVCDQLKIDKLKLIHGRAEDYGQNKSFRNTYDFAVSRAVAELRLLLEFTMPFVKVNGFFIAYKSLKSATELSDAQNALKILKSELVDVKKIKLPNDNGHRDMLIIKKIADIPSKYPRKAGTPKKSPL